jgi:hypothetical protein
MRKVLFIVENFDVICRNKCAKDSSEYITGASGS